MILSECSSSARLNHHFRRLITLDCIYQPQDPRKTAFCCFLWRFIFRLSTYCQLQPHTITHKVERNETPEEYAVTIATLLGEAVEVSVTLECTGVQSSVCNAIQTVKFGVKVFIIGVGKDRMEIPFMRCSANEVDLQFQQRYVNMWPRAIRVLQSGVIDFNRLVTHTFPLENSAEALHTASEPESESIRSLSGRDV